MVSISQKSRFIQEMPDYLTAIFFLQLQQFAGKTFAASRIASNSMRRRMFSTVGKQAAPSAIPSITRIGLASMVVAASLTGRDHTKCDAARRRIALGFQGHRTSDSTGKVISLQGLDLSQLSNETAERLIDALNDGAQFDKESIVKLMSMRRRLSPSTARTLIAALDNGASFDKESLIKLIRLQLTSGPLSSRSY
jgi:hypothetical protein